jgi:hypothetical protein
VEVGRDRHNVREAPAIRIINERLNTRWSALLNALLEVACTLKVGTHE